MRDDDGQEHWTGGGNGVVGVEDSGGDIDGGGGGGGGEGRGFPGMSASRWQVGSIGHLSVSNVGKRNKDF